MIGNNIKNILYEQHKTQVWLSKQCGVTKSCISRIISGKAQPSLKLLAKISEALSVDVCQIIQRGTIGRWNGKKLIQNRTTGKDKLI